MKPDKQLFVEVKNNVVEYSFREFGEHTNSPMICGFYFPKEDFDFEFLEGSMIRAKYKYHDVEIVIPYDTNDPELAKKYSINKCMTLSGMKEYMDLVSNKAKELYPEYK